MDYMRALACQIEVDRLESLARWLDHERGHEPYPMQDELSDPLDQ